MALTPIYDALCLHNEKARASFHMPAHKGGASCLSMLGQTLNFDTTELPDTGSLFDGEGPTAHAEALASQLFGTAATFFSAGGCTLCIQAMLRIAAPDGGKIIAGRMIHRSAVNAMALLGLEPNWVWPEQDAGPYLAGRITARGVEQALTRHPDARAVYLTTPDYYGVLSDVGAISRVAAKYGVPVLVDNAHGAHLRFLGDGSLHPLVRGAAMSADSAHKTLPVLTGGAYLQLAQTRDIPQARAAMALFGSTSPSFPILLSLDQCRAWLEEEGRAAFSATLKQVRVFKEEASRAGYLLPRGECDPLRIFLGTAARGIDGKSAAAHLRQNGIEPEYADAAGVILIPSPFNSPSDWASLRRALHAMPSPGTQLPPALLPVPPARNLTLREALLAPSHRLPIQKAVGKTAAEVVCPCPPAIPAVMPGEQLSGEAAGLLESYGISELTVVK